MKQKNLLSWSIALITGIVVFVMLMKLFVPLFLFTFELAKLFIYVVLIGIITLPTYVIIRKKLFK